MLINWLGLEGWGWFENGKVQPGAGNGIVLSNAQQEGFKGS